jgi:hypothetical protein
MCIWKSAREAVLFGLEFESKKGLSYNRYWVYKWCEFEPIGHPKQLDKNSKKD